MAKKNITKFLFQLENQFHSIKWAKTSLTGIIFFSIHLMWHSSHWYIVIILDINEFMNESGILYQQSPKTKFQGHVASKGIMINITMNTDFILKSAPNCRIYIYTIHRCQSIRLQWKAWHAFHVTTFTTLRVLSGTTFWKPVCIAAICIRLC